MSLLLHSDYLTITEVYSTLPDMHLTKSICLPERFWDDGLYALPFPLGDNQEH